MGIKIIVLTHFYDFWFQLISKIHFKAVQSTPRSPTFQPIKHTVLLCLTVLFLLMSNLLQHLPWFRSINTNSSHFYLYFDILTAIPDLVYMCFLNTWITLFTQAQIAVQIILSQWLDSQPTCFRVCHFCTWGCHGYQSSKRLRQGETMPSHREQTWPNHH